MQICETIDKFMLEQSGRSWSMEKRILTSAKQLFEHAIGKQRIVSNPVAGIRLEALLGPRPPIPKSS